MGKGKLPGGSLNPAPGELAAKISALVSSGLTDRALGLLSDLPTDEALEVLRLAEPSASSRTDLSRYRHLSAALLLPVDPLEARNTLLCDSTDPNSPPQFRRLAREKLDYINQNELTLMDQAGRTTGGFNPSFTW